MKTTIEIPDDLFKKAKATAAVRGESLRDLFCDALEARLASLPQRELRRDGWRSVFGLADRQALRELDRWINKEFERIDPAEWR